MSRFLALVAGLSLTVTLAATRDRSQDANRRWPAGVQTVPDTAPVRAPADEASTFQLAPGFRVELVAGEPLVQDPVAIDWDASGRLWVVEMPGYMPDITASTEHAPVGRVVVLEDADSDGRMDRRTVFADGLVLARSVKVLEHGVLVGEPPYVWVMRDTDGDLRADERVAITDQFGRRDIDVQNNANGFDWGLDNRLRTAGQSRLHWQWKAGTLVAGASPVRGQWGVTHDDVGRTYRNSNESALHVDEVPGEYLSRHPALLRTRGSYERLATDDNRLNVVWPRRPTPGINRGYQAGILRADGTLERYTAACSPLVFRGDRLPREVYGNVFVADPAANLVSRIVLEDDADGGVRARKAYAGAEFLASTDERFRPVFLANAPDGTLTIVDMYRGVIEHRLSLTQYLKTYVEARGLLEPRGLGRIWRVVHESTARDSARPSTRTADDLVTLLTHPNGWWRDTAQRGLVQRGDTTASPALERLARDASEARVRLQALWTLDGLDAVTPALVERAAADASPWVRAAALRIAERWADEQPDGFAALVTRLSGDRTLPVKRQLAVSLGVLSDTQERRTRLAALLSHDDDPQLVDAALSSVRGSEGPLLAALLPRAQARRTLGLTTLSATVFSQGENDAARLWLDRIADDALPEWQREALMHGAEVGVLGAPMPGQLPPLTNPALTCPTCPGGRLSTGGAYAFTDPASFARPPSPGRTLRLTRAPDAFVRLSHEPSRLGKQAAAVLTRVTWPGKPGDDTAPPPLTADEQTRFGAGREVYRASCQACHEADGRGLPGRAAPLVGSPHVLARPEVPVRILLHGKEGATGLMPAIGAALTDAQVAAVLTYVRREWGHGASPVDATAVSRVRAQTTDRTRPWTDAELAALR